MQVEVARDALDLIREEAGAAHPRECCGILLGQGTRIAQAVPADNVHPTPQTHFEIDPQALIDAHCAAREGGPQVVGYYHSHPVGKAEPSRTDAAMASGDGSIWAIIAEDAVSFWRDGERGFAEVSYLVTER